MVIAQIYLNTHVYIICAQLKFHMVDRRLPTPIFYILVIHARWTSISNAPVSPHINPRTLYARVLA